MPRWPERTPEEREAHRKTMKAAKDARYYARNRETRMARFRQYYTENRPTLLEYFSGYRSANREQANKCSRDWHRANRDHTAQVNREWRRANPDKVRVIVRNRKARMRGAEGKHTAADIERLWLVQRSRCACCKSKLAKGSAHVDHIVALANGGSNNPANLQLLCRSCNSSKGAKDPLVFMQSRGLLL